MLYIYIELISQQQIALILIQSTLIKLTLLTMKHHETSAPKPLRYTVTPP